MPFGLGMLQSMRGRSRPAHFRPGMLELLESLHADGYKLALATNSQEWWVIPALEMAEVMELFDVVVSPSDRLKKPATEYYQLLSQKCRVAAEDIVFIDDRRQNIRAADRVGMKAIRFQSAAQVMHDLHSLGIRKPTKSTK